MKISVDLFPPWVQKMTSPWWRLERSAETSAYLLSKLKLGTNNLHLLIHWSHWKNSVYTSRRGMLLWPEVCCFSCMNEQSKCAEMLLRKEFLVFLRALYSSQGPVFLITNNQPTVQFLCPTRNWNNTLLVITTILLLLCTYRVTTERSCNPVSHQSWSPPQDTDHRILLAQKLLLFLRCQKSSFHSSYA